MKYTLIDKPRYFPIEAYDKLIDKIVSRLSKQRCIKSIYQIGSISTPGISDIDLVCVFEDGAVFKEDIRKSLNKDEKYLLCHNLFGMYESNFIEAQKYTFFHNYKLLYGYNYNIESLNNDELKHQIAMEFLTRFLFTLTSQIKLNVIKTRSLLLQVKALLYDLEFLGIHSGSFYNTIQDIINLRNEWFVAKKREIHFLDAITLLYKQLLGFLNKAPNKLYLPEQNIYYIPPNVYFSTGVKTTIKVEGLNLSFLSHIIRNRRFFNASNRLVKFNYKLNYVSYKQSIFLTNKNNYENVCSEINKKKIPNFMVLKSPLN